MQEDESDKSGTASRVSQQAAWQAGVAACVGAIHVGAIGMHSFMPMHSTTLMMGGSDALLMAWSYGAHLAGLQDALQIHLLQEGVHRQLGAPLVLQHVSTAQLLRASSGDKRRGALGSLAHQLFCCKGGAWHALAKQADPPPVSRKRLPLDFVHVHVTHRCESGPLACHSVKGKATHTCLVERGQHAGALWSRRRQHRTLDGRLQRLL